MNNHNTGARLNRLYIVAIGLSLLLIGSLVGLQVAAGGWESLFRTSDGGAGLLYALGFWVASGIVAGLILGKMDAVVVIGNAERWAKPSALDRLIVGLSCMTLRNGMVVQQQIANLISGPLGVGVVYLCCLGLYAVTGMKTFAEYPGYTLMVIPFVTMWKLVECWSRDFLVRRHFDQGAQIDAVTK